VSDSSTKSRTHHAPDDDNGGTQAPVDVVQLQNSQVEHDKVDYVHVSRNDKVIDCQRQPQYEGQ